MEVRCTTLFAVTSLLYLTVSVSLISGKCSGRWAIHACFGGNGKRSDPSLTDNTENTRQESLLRQILLPEPYVYHKTNEDLLQDEDINSYEKSNEESERQQNLRALNILLKTLMMEQKVRNGNSVMA